MNRVRISTTVDAQKLADSRRLSGLADSQMIDRALASLIADIEAEQELAALAAAPYEDDPELSWVAPHLPLDDYEGEIPASVLLLAEERRMQRQQ